MQWREQHAGAVGRAREVKPPSAREARLPSTTGLRRWRGRAVEIRLEDTLLASRHDGAARGDGDVSGLRGDGLPIETRTSKAMRMMFLRYEP